MLIHLGIRDLAVVESLDLEFAGGLTVLTGETGAGKSILLTALGLALGDRADSGIIRPGAARAEINLGFDLAASPAARSWLQENDLTADEDCLVRRVVSQDGRSRAFINNRPVTLQALQEFGSGLAEIHGQHAHVQLLKAPEQRRLLDEAAGNQALVAEVESLYRRWRNLQAELEQRAAAAGDRAAREELLRYQVDELEQHEIAGLDYPGLIEEHQLQANMGRILATAQSQLDVLYDDETRSVCALLAQSVHALSDICALTPEFQECLDLLAEAQVQVKEAVSEIRRRLEHLEADPRRLDTLETRLADVHRLARKHQVKPEQLAERGEALKTELAALGTAAESIDALRAELDAVESAYLQAATALSQRRHAGAGPMQDRITAVIRELGMPQGAFMVAVSTPENREFAAHGLDHVEFLVSANPGLPPRPLSRVASGGELSRISLAIQVAATDSKTVPTLVFDEVDTGIGGGIAEIVGRKLRVLGTRGHQVFCVTHLPQVASQGHHHWLVAKTTDGEETRTVVRQLDGEPRVAEIARMLGGVKVTRNTLAHAAEMLAAPGHGEE